MNNINGIKRKFLVKKHLTNRSPFFTADGLYYVFIACKVCRYDDGVALENCNSFLFRIGFEHCIGKKVKIRDPVCDSCGAGKKEQI